MSDRLTRRRERDWKTKNIGYSSSVFLVIFLKIVDFEARKVNDIQGKFVISDSLLLAI